jgi:hypothetical protein
MVGNSFHMLKSKRYFNIIYFYVKLKPFEVDEEENGHFSKWEKKDLVSVC